MIRNKLLSLRRQDMRFRFWSRLPRLSYLWLLCLSLLFILPCILSFPYPSAEAPYSDISISHFPNAIFLRHSILKWHTIPLWSPTILSGYPFAANPLSGLWYPPGWIALLLPLPFGFNFMVMMHLLWGGVGTYSFLRMEGIDKFVSLMGGLAFESMPKLFAHYGAGHLTLVYAVTWTPWLLLAEAIRDPGKRILWKPKLFGVSTRLFQPGIILALTFLADPRWSIFAGCLWVGYILVNNPRIRIRGFTTQTLIAILLTAPLALPLLEYTRLSTRTGLSPTDVLIYSLPVGRLLEFIYPFFGGFQEWTFYPGAVILLLGIIGMFWIKTRPRSKFWIGVFIITLVFSLGEQVPGLVFLSRLPGINLLRVPARALFLMDFSLIILACNALDQLLTAISNADMRFINITMFVIAGFVTMLTGGIWFLMGNLPKNIGWGWLVILVVLIWLVLYLRNKLPLTIFLAGVGLLGLIDWGYSDLSAYAPHTVAEVTQEKGSVVSYISEIANGSRIYSPSYSIPQQTAALQQLELADGVDPLQLKSYAEFMQKASGVPSQGYSVTLPPFGDDDPSYANAEYSPDPQMLGLLNVGYLVSEFDIKKEGFDLVARFGETRLYKNLKEMPRAWIQPDKGGENALQASITFWSPNRISVKATGPGSLVVSEVAYPGWRVYVDGKRSDIVVTDKTLRSVRINTGLHEVIFVYRPLSVYLGLLLFIIGVILVLKKGENPLIQEN
jgi:hypothetical protein